MDRILLVTATLGKWGETNGVVNTYLNLIYQFKKRDMVVDVLTYGPKDRTQKDKSVTITTRRPRVPLKVDADLILDTDFSLTTLSTTLSKNNYSLVHSATPDLLGWLAVLVARECDCPLVSAFHTSLSEYAQIRSKEIVGSYTEKIFGGVDKSLSWLFDPTPITGLGKTISREILGSTTGKITGDAMTMWLQMYFNNSDLILAPSHFTKEKLKKYFKVPIEVLSRGVNIENFNPCHREGNLDISKPKALYVGRVAPEKNLTLLVELLSKRPNIHLTVVGDGPYFEAMKEKLPNAEYMGKLSGEELYKAYANGDFFVFPSHTDTFGNVVLEAMSSGLPVVVTDVMAPKEQVKHGVTGFIAKTDDNFADAIDTLANDTKMRKKMGKAARAYAETRSWDAVFETLLNQYELAKRLHQS